MRRYTEQLPAFQPHDFEADSLRGRNISSIIVCRDTILICNPPYLDTGTAAAFENQVLPTYSLGSLASWEHTPAVASRYAPSLNSSTNSSSSHKSAGYQVTKSSVQFKHDANRAQHVTCIIHAQLLKRAANCTFSSDEFLPKKTRK